jgi:tRNA(Ile2) C34 agmatinyltransferase TiaS|nr:hypothetical protein [Kofleriaceae bacterium]
MQTYLVAVDDTDFGESIGTGALIRELGASFERAGVGSIEGITRHQLLVHPDIPYTSHNSSACLALDTERTLDDVVEHAAKFVVDHLHAGADPAICVLEERAGGSLSAFGKRCQAQVVTKADAHAAIAAAGAHARELGGTGGGVIGAAAAIGLRATGNDGRFISARGTRSHWGRLTVADIVGKMMIHHVVDLQQRVLPPDMVVHVTIDGVRPDLIDGHAVLAVRPRADGDYEPLPTKKDAG